MQLITASRLRDARACQRLHRYRYVDGYRPAETSGPQRFGTLLHLGLEAWWRGSGDDRLSAASHAMAGESDPFDLAKAEELLLGYHLRWGAEPYEVIAVEAEFHAPLVNPATGQPSRTWRLAGKIDVLVRDPRDGSTLLVEHKSASEDITPGSDYWRRLRMDGQISQYYEGARALGHRVHGCLYDVILKPALRPLLATPIESRKFTKDGKLYAVQRDHDETPEEYRVRIREAIAAEPNRYYARGTVVRLESEMAEALHDVWQITRQIREAELAGRHPRNPDACVRYGRTCQFFDVCTGAASLDDPALFTREENIHPELTWLDPTTTPTHGPKEEESDVTAAATP